MNRATKLHAAVQEQIAPRCDENEIDTVKDAHAKLVVVMNHEDFQYMMDFIFAVGPRHERGSQRKLQACGFDVWKSPAIPVGNPRLLTVEDAAGVVSEFAEKLHGIK